MRFETSYRLAFEYDMKSLLPSMPNIKHCEREADMQGHLECWRGGPSPIFSWDAHQKGMH